MAQKSWFRYGDTLEEQLEIVQEYIEQIQADIDLKQLSPLSRRILIKEQDWLKELLKEYGELVVQ